MSFLSRRSSSPDKRDGRADAARRGDSEYDDYDYAPDDYQQHDENWSPDEYFSPEGIKGRWAAGARPGERDGVRGRHGSRDASRDAGRGARDPGRGYDEYEGYDAGPQRA